MNEYQYAPKSVYQSINLVLNDLEFQSNILYSVTSNVSNKCLNHEIVSEFEIDETINAIRNYILVKENCLEQSKQILDIDSFTSIDELSNRLKEHENNSIKIYNDTLKYAYEFLKIKSNNIITDSLLQNHREKLNSIIASMSEENVHIDDVEKSLEPYRVALLYLNYEINDLTEYAELIYKTFEPILLYNIISRSNLEILPLELDQELNYQSETSTTNTINLNSIDEMETTELKNPDDISINLEPIEPVEEVSTESTTIDVKDVPTDTEENTEILLDEECLPFSNKDTFFNELFVSITKNSFNGVILDNPKPPFDEELALDSICNYILENHFDCASMLLREYSSNSDTMSSLYNQYSIAMGDPLVNIDYSTAFFLVVSEIVSETIQSWLKLSALFREMFIYENKNINCHICSSYFNTYIQQSEHNITTYLVDFDEIIKILNEINYSADYLLNAELSENEKYKNLKSKLISLFITNCNELSNRIADNIELSKLDKAGMVCLIKTLNDIIDYMQYQIDNQKYFYCEFLKTDYFLLDKDYIPYFNETIDSIDDFNISSRVLKHLEEVKSINSWKEAIENNLKNCNAFNVNLIVSYLKSTNQDWENIDYYLDKANNLECPIENAYNMFFDDMNSLCLMEVLTNSNINGTVFYLEDIVRSIIVDNGNYGFYERFLQSLKDYAIRLSIKEYTQNNGLIDKISVSTSDIDSAYYNNIINSIDNQLFCISDELISMYFKGLDYPNLDIDSSKIEKYNKIFSQFVNFCNEYALKLNSSMKEVYNKDIQQMISKNFSNCYEVTTSEELIDTWEKSKKGKNIIYDILTNIGFNINKEDTIEIDMYHSKISLSNSEKKEDKPYSIPENVLFLNDKVFKNDNGFDSLSITEDTLIIFDYSIDVQKRQDILKKLNEISNGNRVVLIDRCVIMYLTTLPRCDRKLAFKVCGICNELDSISNYSDFRMDYIQKLSNTEKCNFLFGRKYFGKTSILNSVFEILKCNRDNIVIKINAQNDNLSTTDLILNEVTTLSLGITPFLDWSSFEISIDEYLTKNSNSKITILIDNAEFLLETCINSTNEIQSIMKFKELSRKFNDRFVFTIFADMYQDYTSYAERNDLTYSILNPLTYTEVSSMFKSYFNSYRVSITDENTMNMLVSKTFGCPKMVNIISEKVMSVINQNSISNLSPDKYVYSITMEDINQALANQDFMNVSLEIFLNTLIGSRSTDSNVLPVIYSIVYYLYENSTDIFTLENIQSILNFFNIEETDKLSVQLTLEELKTLGLIIKLNDTDYFLSHKCYKSYIGNKEFTFNILDQYNKIFNKEGINI